MGLGAKGRLLETKSIIGQVETLLARAAVHAIRTGAERIDRQVVHACGHHLPSERRRPMAQAPRSCHAIFCLDGLQDID